MFNLICHQKIANKTTKYHSTLIKMAKIQNVTKPTPNAGENVEQ